MWFYRAEFNRYARFKLHASAHRRFSVWKRCVSNTNHSFAQNNGRRADKADLVFAICKGNIVGVFKPHRWFQTKCEKYKGRWEFEGEQIFNSPYMNQDISKIASNRQNPVMYINM